MALYHYCLPISWNRHRQSVVMEVEFGACFSGEFQINNNKKLESLVNVIINCTKEFILFVNPSMKSIH